MTDGELIKWLDDMGVSDNERICRLDMIIRNASDDHVNIHDISVVAGVLESLEELVANGEPPEEDDQDIIDLYENENGTFMVLSS